MSLSPEDLNTIVKLHVGKMAETLSEEYERVTGRELSDKAFDVLATRFQEGAEDAVLTASQVDDA